MESRKNVSHIIEDFIKGLIQEFNAGEDCVTSITISPHLFDKLLEEYVIARYVPTDWHELRSLNELEINLQSGSITIVKDVSKIIERKERQIESLLKDIEELKNEH